MLNTTQSNLGYSYFAVSVFICDKAEKLIDSLCGLLEAHIQLGRMNHMDSTLEIC